MKKFWKFLCDLIGQLSFPLLSLLALFCFILGGVYAAEIFSGQLDIYRLYTALFYYGLGTAWLFFMSAICCFEYYKVVSDYSDDHNEENSAQDKEAADD